MQNSQGFTWLTAARLPVLLLHPLTMQQTRIVITGVGLTSPNGNTLEEYRKNLLEGIAGVQLIDMRYMGEVPAGVCDFDPKKYQTRKELRVGTRAGSIAIYAAHEAIAHSEIGRAHV